jgi:hypothetical protein
MIFFAIDKKIINQILSGKNINFNNHYMSIIRLKKIAMYEKFKKNYNISDDGQIAILMEKKHFMLMI